LPHQSYEILQILMWSFVTFVVQFFYRIKIACPARPKTLGIGELVVSHATFSAVFEGFGVVAFATIGGAAL
jgi:hypothetical protein